jgi:hypothetical protein
MARAKRYNFSSQRVRVIGTVSDLSTRLCVAWAYLNADETIDELPADFIQEFENSLLAGNFGCRGYGNSFKFFMYPA